MCQAVGHHHLIAEAWPRYRSRSRGICVAQSGTGTDYSKITSILLCQYHSTNAPYPLIYHKRYIILETEMLKTHIHQDSCTNLKNVSTPSISILRFLNGTTTA
jgi:hypothetical protein